jgi:hypothetical protein
MADAPRNGTPVLLRIEIGLPPRPDLKARGGQVGWRLGLGRRMAQELVTGPFLGRPNRPACRRYISLVSREVWIAPHCGGPAAVRFQPHAERALYIQALNPI